MLALELRGITKTFGSLVANDAINLSVARGEIHGLLGENGAGKTTLMNILLGLVRKDQGEIRIDGQPVEIRSPADAITLGIGMLHQHFQLVPNISVAENIALTVRGRWLRNDIRSISKRVGELSDLYRFGICPDARISDLSVGQQQRVEILKLVYSNARIMILDEPTAVLAPEEWEAFAGLLHQFADEGCSIVFISHKMKEHFDISDNCTILRRGKVVGNLNMAEASDEEIVNLMIGRPVEVVRAGTKVAENAPVVLQVENLMARSASGRILLDDISLAIRQGETLGIAGVDGNGQEELVDAILGLVPLESGTVRLNGKDITGRSPKRWRELGGALITADRHATGVALELSLAHNMLIPTAKAQGLLRMGFLKARQATAFVDKRMRDFGVYGGDALTPMSALSGGNQQKIVLARELGQRATVAIVAQSTRGLDVGAAQFVYETLNEHRRKLGSTLLISTEIDELLLLADRIAVMLHGRIIGVLDNDESFEFDHLARMMAGEALQ